MKKITVSILTAMLMLSMVFSSSVFAAEKENSAWDSFVGLFSAKAASDDVGVEYRGHVQNIGNYPTDGSWIQGPEQLGTVGKSLRLEAFWIKLTDAPEGLHIKYEVHVQNIGWMAPEEDGAMAGTEGDSLRIEAIKISLVDDEGNVSGDYTVTYKGHIQNVGDTAWITSGNQLGTTGSGLRLEALEIKIEKIAPDLADYTAALGAVTEANYTKASWATYQDVVEANVMTEDNVQSEVDAATTAILDAQADLVTVPVISAMTATAQKTITVTGIQLDKLATTNLTVAGNTVASVTPSADGKSAAVVLTNDLIPDTNTLVTATVESVATEYTVKYTIPASTVSIPAATYDDDTANQKLSLLVDGVPTTVEYLNLAGYTVNFTSWDENGAATTALFAGVSQTSTTGVLASNLTAARGTYQVQVTIAKGSTIATSERTNIVVKDLNNNTEAINAYKMYLGNDNTGVKLNSTTLVYGETAVIYQVTVGAGSTQSILDMVAGYPAAGYTVTSSDSTVLSVDNTTGVITAAGIGSANLTITAGKATKVIPITVSGVARTVSKVAPSTSAFTYIIGGSAATNAVTMTVTDQYGDPFNGTNIAATALTYTGPGITDMVPDTAPGAIDTGVDGKFTLGFGPNGGTEPLTTATGSIVFKNSKGTTLGSFSIKVTDVTNLGSQKVVITSGSSSQDNTINTDLETGITFQVANYNKNGVFTGYVADLTGYQVLFDSNILAADGIAYDADINGVTLGATATYTLELPTTVLAGSTIVKVYNTDTKLIDTRTVTVVNNAPYIKTATFKSVATVDYAKTINFKDVLDTELSDNDDIIKSGITLSSSSPFTMRIGETAGEEGYIYLDKVADGVYTAGDILLGNLTAVVSSTTGTVPFVAVGTPAVDAMTGIPTVAGNVGVMTFVVTDTASPDQPTTVNTTGVKVNVPVV